VQFRKESSQVRIIGGKWRSRRLSFPVIPALRPTPDRVRETLFNWLQPFIQDAVCLDPFAGSGALGFEALSRGARWVSFLDSIPRVIDAIQQQIARFDASEAARVEIGCFPILPQFPSFFSGFTLVFLDPPFHQGLIATSLRWLDTQSILSPVSYIYVEYETDLSLPVLPSHWRILRSKRAGQVCYSLLERACHY